MRKIWVPLSQRETEEINGPEVFDINATAKGMVRGAAIEEETFLLDVYCDNNPAYPRVRAASCAGWTS